jgi:hypothetical protein
VIALRDAGAQPFAMGRRWHGRQLVAAVAVLVAGCAIRAWNLGGAGPSFDEAFTAAYASLPVDELPGALAANDSHPPLDYLIRHWVASLHDTGALRSPSLAASAAALLLMGCWMARRGWWGVIALGVFAFDPFLILHGRQARMYALVAFLGLIVAFSAERWLLGPCHARWRWLATAALLFGALTHVSALALAIGLLFLAGRRRDREAWRWRGCVALALGAWAVLWGRSFLSQLNRNDASWIAHTTVGGVDDAIRGLVMPFHDVKWLVTAAVLAGGAALLRWDRPLARVWWSLFAVTAGMVAVAGIWSRVLLPRTLGVVAWGAPLALVAGVAWLWERSRIAAGSSLAVLCLVVAVSVRHAVAFDEGTERSMQRMVGELDEGDLVLIHPSWLWPSLRWAVGSDPQAQPGIDVPQIDSAAFSVGVAPPSGRVWLMQPRSYRGELPVAWPSCSADPPVLEGWRFECRVAPPP